MLIGGYPLSDDESVATAFSHAVAPGDQIRHWAHCSAGPETVTIGPSDLTWEAELPEVLVYARVWPVGIRCGNQFVPLCAGGGSNRKLPLA